MCSSDSQKSRGCVAGSHLSRSAATIARTGGMRSLFPTTAAAGSEAAYAASGSWVKAASTPALAMSVAA